MPAGELHAGEWLASVSGRAVRVGRITSHATPQPVYNLEVHRTHVDHVGPAGVRVHNTCTTAVTREQKDAFRAAARDLWEGRTGRRAIWDDLEIHHRIPLEWAHIFPSAPPNRIANLIGLDEATHGAVSAVWTTFRTSLNGAEPTPAQVMKQALQIDALFGDSFTFLP